MKKIFSAVMAVAVILAVGVGCKSLNPNTGQVEFDPVKTEQVKAAIEPVVSSAVRRVVIDNPETAQYFQQAVDVFVQMRDTQQFSPEYLVLALDKAAEKEDWFSKLDPEVAGYVLDAKNLMIALYRINFADAGRADLSPEKFAWNLLDVLASGVGQGLKDAGVGS